MSSFNRDLNASVPSLGSSGVEEEKNGSDEGTHGAREHKTGEMFCGAELDECALHHACRDGNIEMVRQLLARDDVDVNGLTDTGVSPLSIACENGDVKIVGLLLDSDGRAN